MASRFPVSKPLDYCYNPVRVQVDHDFVYVPCGKCDGCKLHKANEWSMRLGSEIEDNRLAIFFTLTYNNHYLPTFRYIGLDKDSHFERKLFSCSHAENVRFDGARDVLRKERFLTFSLPMDFHGIKATNYVCDVEYFPYSSKRDFQLYLKLLRKDLYEKFQEGFFFEAKEEEDIRFSYYCISEYGETLLRPHLHGVILPHNAQVAEYLCYEGLFASWEMCDKNMFQQHCHFADSGCRGYITQYLTCGSSLPSVYHEAAIKPWRLSSKGRAIGYNGFDETKVLEDIVAGVDVYCKTISRIDERYLLRYPKGLGTRLFPKCYEFRKKDFFGLYRLYSLAFFAGKGSRFPIDSGYLNSRLYPLFNPADVQATKTCFKICEMMSWHPFTYVYALDMYYYKNSMAALRFWYEWQQNQSDVYAVIKSYNNFDDYRKKFLAFTATKDEVSTLSNFLSGFSLDLFDIIWSDFDKFISKVDVEYTSEVSDILADMVKMPKFNEKFGFSPNSDNNFNVSF